MSEFAASNLATSMQGPFNMVAIYSAGAVNTLVSEAKGSGKKEFAHMWLRCGIYFAVVTAIFCACGFLTTRPMLSLIRPDDIELLSLAEQFSILSTSWLLPVCCFSVIQQYFQALEVLWPALVASVFAVLLNIFFNGFFIHGTLWFSLDSIWHWEGLGFLGSPLATLGAHMIKWIMIWYLGFYWKNNSKSVDVKVWSEVCINQNQNLNENHSMEIDLPESPTNLNHRYNEIDEEKNSENSESEVAVENENSNANLSGPLLPQYSTSKVYITSARIIKYLRLYVPLSLMILVEDSGFNVLTLYTAKLPNDDVNAISLLWQVWFIAWACFCGLPLATQGRVAAHLGANKPVLAQHTARTLLLSAACFQALMMTCLYFSRSFLFSIWTDEAKPKQIAEQLLPLCSFSFALSSMGYSIIYILQGAAQPGQSACVVAVATWCIMVPLAFIMCFPFGLNLGIRGIWWAVLIGEMCKFAGLIPLYLKLDFRKAAENARERQL
eukprot:g2840.t1